MISATLSGRTFEANIDRLQTGKTYYIRAFAENSAGLLHGSVRKIRLKKEYLAPFDGVAMGQGWHRSDWFGTFRTYPGMQWIFHAEFGWLYHRADQPERDLVLEGGRRLVMDEKRFLALPVEKQLRQLALLFRGTARRSSVLGLPKPNARALVGDLWVF